MYQVTQHIVKLLYEHNCVIVPGLGGFVTNYQPAKVHPTSFIFNSPGKSVAFNVSLSTNDGLLADTIARQEGISHRDADKLIVDFVSQIKTALSESKPVKLSGIGRLTMDVEGQIRFLPDNTQNFQLQSYGLYSFTAQPITRDRQQIEVQTAKPVQAIEVPARKKRKFSDALLPIAIVLLICMGAMQVFIQKDMNGFNYSEIFGLSKLFPHNDYALKRYETDVYQINSSITYFRRTMPAPADTTVADSSSLTTSPAAVNTQPVSTHATYFVSAGSFYSSSQAQKVVDKIAAKGYTGYVKPYGKYQVAAVDIPDNISQSAFRKAFIEATGIKGAWIGKN
ncbi:MAG TPA: HU family DNA-binding protein [Chitinophagales bacterium]|nr:HU family DNA-binding protein [Chitinophagales bacterium]HMZ89632.1 HU family DNA-binding protein [Chitinophagales bacterium]HNA57132.1 HU family DNA-binding protein [Chitinophagales bacterium]HNE44650.1 HU family DNA-binding protein [Chitinophagales bacterium]HNI54932.1 HU family DNA-binding protein [Chitinophagales bacterium]